MELGGGALAAFGVAPAPAFGGVFHLGVQLFPRDRGGLWLSVAAEARADAPASGGASGGQGSVTATLLGGSLLLCVHRDLRDVGAVTLSALGCAVGTAGAVRGTAREPGGAVAFGLPYAGVGPRLGLEGRLGAIGAVRLDGDALPTVHPAEVRGGGGAGERWRTFAVTGSASVAVIALF